MILLFIQPRNIATRVHVTAANQGLVKNGPCEGSFKNAPLHHNLKIFEHLSGTRFQHGSFRVGSEFFHLKPRVSKNICICTSTLAVEIGACDNSRSNHEHESE